MSIFNIKFYIYVSAILTLFISATLLDNLGYQITMEYAPLYYKLHPSFILMFILITYYLLPNLISRDMNIVRIYLNKKNEFHFLFFLFFLTIYILIMKLSGAIASIPNTLILPLFFSILLNRNDISFLKKLRKLLLIFFILNSSMAITEMFLKYSFLRDSTSYYTHFRSTALLGHPLNNALITSVIMAFILTSAMNEYRKQLLMLLGLFSLLCYGARAAVFTWCVMLPIYIVFFVPAIKSFVSPFGKIIRIGTMIGVILIFIFLITQTPYGARINEMSGMDDASAETRLLALDFFKNLKMQDVLLGAPVTKMAIYQDYLGVDIIENFWIAWIIRFGLIMTLLLTFFFIKFLYNNAEYHGKFSSFFIPLVFLAIASSNNSLATTTPVISVYVLCSYAFNPFLASYRLISHRQL